ncbi:hypothetical protein EIK76_01180 [Rheinheimera mesophila]|uniref:Phage tail protein n=1 Tax=Rheinheimera mesophila TaxID=1547515 RepID=A0A3P3QPF8_9GAMM|nr:hypothetical protein [Rheinheimera mesophila]KKL00994.1 hypothetical protein SD53_12195 [Rheinheimera mesophila]RRJ22728.1 hypothetical protein EIK76_01180 [Rheinheimera mesophila]
MIIDWASLTKMPYWLAKPGGELDKLRKGMVRFWQRFVDMLQFASQQMDPMTAELEFVHLLAWERDIEQIPGETELIYRTRVKYSLPFAKGAGSKSGWLDMFTKLGMPGVAIEERFSETDWDVVDLMLLDDELGTNQPLINSLCRQYGRTTRRYQYSTLTVVPFNTALSTFDKQSSFEVAAVNTNLRPVGRFMTMENQSSFQVAKITQGT